MDNVKVGDIFLSMWGYDQTNVDFYQVISRTAKMVKVRKLQCERVGNPHDMATELMPKKDCFLDSDHPYDQRYGKVMTCKVLNSYKDEPMIKTSCSYAFLWDGKSRTETYTG